MNRTVINNPVIWSDLPDEDVLRIGNTFYMVSTSMHSMPGCPVMKSQDLMHWELVNYVFDTLEDNDEHNLVGGKDVYGKGSWAASLRFNKGTYYVCFTSLDSKRFYIYRTDDIENGSWNRSVFDGIYHDPSLLFDEGRVFVLYGNGDIRITELTQDAAAVKPDGIRRLLFSTETENIMLRCEGCHAYRINGTYYLLFIEWPKNGRRRQICYRCATLLGPYERKVIFDDDMGYFNHGIAQGAIFDDPNGGWYAMLFQDHDAVGRIPYILPVTWEDGWPMIGVLGKAPEEWTVPLPSSAAKELTVSDEFDEFDEFDDAENKLKLNWQWNHNPDNRLWSLKERPGFLRLRTGNIAADVLHARNTLTQRTEGPACSAVTLMEFERMKPGDSAGMIALQNTFGWVGVRVSETGERSVAMCVNRGDGRDQIVEQTPIEASRIFLRVEFDFEQSADLAAFSYSLDGENWKTIGYPLKMKYTLDHFMGYRIGLFCYAAAEAGGYADFDFFHYAKRNRPSDPTTAGGRQ